MSFDYKVSKNNIASILDNKTDIDAIKTIPKNDDEFTYDNGIKSWVSAIFIDIVDSSTLFKNSSINKNVLTRILRSFASELITILNDDENVRDVGIRGDCVYAIYAAPYQQDLMGIFRHAYCVNTFMVMLNQMLSKRGFPTIKAGIGLGCGEDIIIKAGKKKVYHDYIWIGDAVINADKLSKVANRRGIQPICMDSLFYSNVIELLKKENNNYSTWIVPKNSFSYDGTFYQCDIVQTNFNEWINNGMKDE